MSETTVDRSYYPPLSKEIATWQRDYTPGPLTQDEFYRFFEDGYVIKHNLLKRDQLETVIHCIERLVDELAQELHRAVRIFSLKREIFVLYIRVKSKIYMKMIVFTNA
jgi:hypothetical protein